MEYGLIGEKLGHSFSKIIHESISNYKYELKELSLEELDIFMKSKDFKAINVTIPYKEKVIPYLDEISNEAKRIGAVNTIINVDGKLYGYNTDYYGLKYLIEKENINLLNKNALILGSGGTSKTAKALLTDLGVNKIYQASRKETNEFISYDNIYDLDIDFIINTTPVGMYPNNKDRLIDLSKFNNLCGVIDCIYNPLNSNLILDAKSKKIPSAGGLLMLVVQAVYAKKYFLNEELDVGAINTAYNKLLNLKRNIVLIGMPSCGKTTIGEILSKKLNMDLIDIDTLIEQEINMDIKTYIESNGEKAFRDIESMIVYNESIKGGRIISTGGGVILREENMHYLKQNGIIVFIDRDLSLLIPTNSRPLSNNKIDLEKRYNERTDLYNNYSDLTIKNNNDINDSINDILRGIGI